MRIDWSTRPNYRVPNGSSPTTKSKPDRIGYLGSKHVDGGVYDFFNFSGDRRDLDLRATGAAMKLDRALLKILPKVLLHEHLDGVLRPQTVIDLARATGYAGLPTEDPAQLAAWFYQGANKGSLAEYLLGFAHTIAVTQTEEALERVAY